MRGRLGLAALAVAASSVQADAPASAPVGTIRWVAQNMPPHFSFVGGQPPRSAAELGRGELDGFLRVLLARLPQYRHEFVEVGTARFEKLSRAGETLCSTMHVRTPQRLEWLHFSHMFPPRGPREIQVVLRRDMLERVVPLRSDDAPLRLADLLAEPSLRPLLAKERAFGPQIDRLLALHPVPRLAVGAHLSLQLLGMLRAGRMDYTLEYGPVVTEYLQRVGDAGALVVLPVAEGYNTELATVACSRNSQGRRHLEAIDAAVRALAREPDRETWVREWRGDRSTPQEMKRLNAYMDERARGGPRIE